MRRFCLERMAYKSLFLPLSKISSFHTHAKLFGDALAPCPKGRIRPVHGGGISRAVVFKRANTAQ
jgi:hypothetical protein